MYYIFIPKYFKYDFKDPHSLTQDYSLYSLHPNNSSRSK